MKYHSKSGRYFVWNGTDKLDQDFQVLKFPNETEIGEIWERHCPGKPFSLGSYIDRPINGFWANAGSGTTPKQRQAFCDELLQLCEIPAA